jgi:hypothetical protein
MAWMIWSELGAFSVIEIFAPSRVERFIAVAV